MVAARAELGPAYRRLGHAIAGHVADAEVLRRLTRVLHDAAAELETAPVRDRSSQRSAAEGDGVPADGELMFSFDERPVSGRSAPLGFDLEVRREGDEAVGRLTLGRAHEGAPQRSHGGIISALLDDMFGFVLAIERQAGFTGELTVRYEAGTPIGVPLQCRVRLTERDGRKLHMTGEVTRDDDVDTVFVRARAVFIAVDPDAFRRMTAAAD